VCGAPRRSFQRISPLSYSVAIRRRSLSPRPSPLAPRHRTHSTHSTHTARKRELKRDTRRRRDAGRLSIRALAKPRHPASRGVENGYSTIYLSSRGRRCSRLISQPWRRGADLRAKSNPLEFVGRPKAVRGCFLD
jgi:hypothetical protein